MPLLQDPITPEKQKHLEGILDRVRTDALANPDVSFLTIVKFKNHPQIMLETGGDEAEREQLMAFFMKWVMQRAQETLQKIQT